MDNVTFEETPDTYKAAARRAEEAAPISADLPCATCTQCGAEVGIVYDPQEPMPVVTCARCAPA